MLLFLEGFEENLHAETRYIAGIIFVILFRLRSIALSLPGGTWTAASLVN